MYLTAGVTFDVRYLQAVLAGSSALGACASHSGQPAAADPLGIRLTRHTCCLAAPESVLP